MALGNDVTLKVGFDIDKFQAELAKTNGILNKWGSSVSSTLKTAAAGFGLVEIARGVIDVTSEFQKFEAILTNTLGSNSEAKKALDNIKEFAISTPFEVSEITAAYVRWANMGLTPTIDRMKKLGDIASSLGAGFEQTAEAFKDLMVGQTKRIEEVGISAQQANGKIQLSFKGVNIEIDKSAEGVQKALDVYSQLNGVLGTSDAISKTLGGRISNLKDVWAQLMQTIGEGNSGVLYQTVESLTRITAAMANAGKEAAIIGQALSPFHDLRDVSKETLDYLLKWGRTDTGRPVQELLKFFDQVDFNKIKSDYFGWHEEFINAFLAEGESIADAGVLWDAYYEKRKKAYSDELAEKAKAVADQLTLEKKKAQEAALAYAKLAAEKSKIVGLRPIKEVQSKPSLENAIIPQPEAIPNQVAAPFSVIPQEVLDANAVAIDKYNEQAEAIKTLNQDISQSFVEMGVNVLEILGTKLGDASYNIGKGLKVALGGFLSHIGKMLIKFGLGAKAFQQLLKNLTNPVAAGAAIAAGAALVVAGAAISASARNAASGIGGGGGDGGTEGRGTVNPNTQPDRRYIFELKAKGSDLIAVIDTAQQDNKIRRGG